MIVKNIYLGDFGIFQNENLTDIAPGIVVIGGGNRAGKSTFMQVLRHLGYGFPRDRSLPPPVDEYHVEADLKLTEAAAQERSGPGPGLYHINIKGYASPRLSLSASVTGNKDNQEIEAADLYNNLDRFTYRQLFTISLDELQKLPEEISGEKAEDRLYSVLLGAGLSQIMELPQVARYYDRRAEEIGGKLGDPGVGKFKPYQAKISEAEEKKEEALKQVEKFKRTENRIKELENEITEFERKISQKKQKRMRMDVLKNNYDNFSNLIKLQKELKQHKGLKLSETKHTSERKIRAENFLENIQQAGENYRDILSQFQAEVSSDREEKIRSKLLSLGSRLENYANRISGLRNKVENYRELKENLQESYNQLRLEAGEINTKWKEDLSQLGSVRTDEIERGNLLKTIDQFNNLDGSIQSKQEKEREIKISIKKLQKQLNELKHVDASRIIRLAVSGAILSFGAGAATSWLDLIAGIFAAGTGLVLTFIYFISNFQQARNLQTRRQKIQSKLKNHKLDLSNIQDELEKLARRQQKLAEVLDNYREQLGLSESASPELIKDYFSSLRNLKIKYGEWQLRKQTAEEKSKELKRELNELRKILQELNKEFAVTNYNLPQPENLISKSDRLFSGLERAMEYLNLARKLKAAAEKKKETEREAMNFIQKLADKSCENEAKKAEPLQQQLRNFIERVNLCQDFRELKDEFLNIQERIIESINSSDRIREAFLDLNREANEKITSNDTFVFSEKLSVQEENLLHIFSVLYDEHTSQEEVNETYQDVSTELSNLRQELKTKRELLQTLRDKREQLASPQNIEEVHASLDEARTQLRKLAEKYAINRSISFILEKVKERAINRAREELLEPAGELLREMTGGAIQEISPSEDLKNKDFATLFARGEKHDSVDNLSRGTREQLFLAVRISRIQEIEPPLPVILDDSLVNFDRFHLESAAQILSRLGKSHQIFLLTCHPHLVKYIHNSTETAQYWHLSQGKFTRTDARKLKHKLSSSS